MQAGDRRQQFGVDQTDAVQAFASGDFGAAITRDIERSAIIHVGFARRGRRQRQAQARVVEVQAHAAGRVAPIGAADRNRAQRRHRSRRHARLLRVLQLPLAGSKLVHALEIARDKLTSVPAPLSGVQWVFEGCLKNPRDQATALIGAGLCHAASSSVRFAAALAKLASLI